MRIYHNYRGLERGGCSTVIIGRKASTTGNFIVGHNEDDTDAVVQTHLVPRQMHEAGEKVVFDDGTAIIDQVPVTNAYYWSEVRCDGGISFADVCVNEYGVVIVSNACRPSNDATGVRTDNSKAYGLGYALRILVAERAKTAREAVKVAADLVEKYGYFSSRSYQFVDKDEAWVVQVPKGYGLCARRVQDDEIYYMPNHYTIHHVDPEDTENYYVSPKLISTAIENGWYKPAKQDDCSDFDFAAAYQQDYEHIEDYNYQRAYVAWKYLNGSELTYDSSCRVFSMKAEKKYSPADVKKVLRSHYENTKYDLTVGGKNPHLTSQNVTSICNGMTIESTVFELNEDPNLLCMNRAAPKGCLSPYIPFYPVAMTRIPDGFEWMGYAASRRSHFAVDRSELVYDPRKAWYLFKTVQYLTDFNYRFASPYIHEGIALLEEEWDKEKESIQKAYKNFDADGGKEFLTSYTCAQAEKAMNWARETINYLANDRAAGKVND